VVDLYSGVVDAEHPRRFVSMSLRGLDKRHFSDPWRHGRFLEPEKFRSRPDIAGSKISSIMNSWVAPV